MDAVVLLSCIVYLAIVFLTVEYDKQNGKFGMQILLVELSAPFLIALYLRIFKPQFWAKVKQFIASALK